MHVIGPIVRFIDPGRNRHERDPFRGTYKNARKFSTHDPLLLFTSSAGTRQQKTFISLLKKHSRDFIRHDYRAENIVIGNKPFKEIALTNTIYSHLIHNLCRFYENREIL